MSAWLAADAILQQFKRHSRPRFPERHRQFLASLTSSIAIGDYFFCHAGVRPGVPLDRQDRNDLLTIRDTFLSSEVEHGKLVVHGHTPSLVPEIRPNRIGIDTAAYATGRLTCLVLEKDQRRFLHVGGHDAERPAERQWAPLNRQEEALANHPDLAAGTLQPLVAASCNRELAQRHSRKMESNHERRI